MPSGSHIGGQSGLLVATRPGIIAAFSIIRSSSQSSYLLGSLPKFYLDGMHSGICVLRLLGQRRTSSLLFSEKHRRTLPHVVFAHSICYGPFLAKCRDFWWLDLDGDL